MRVAVFTAVLPLAIAIPSGRTHESASTNGTSQVVILADTNRDGKVDIKGTSDLGEGKKTWTNESGALFLPNIGDTSDRCRNLHEDKRLLLACNDASDDVQRAPKYLAPLLTTPIDGLSASAVGRISVSDPIARQNVRIFRPKVSPESKEGQADDWTIVDNDMTFSAEELAKGLRLGIDARATRGHLVDAKTDTPRTWDGRVTKVFTFVRDSNTEIFDGIAAGVKKAGINEPVQEMVGASTFVQDLFETMYASIPGPDGSVISLPIILPAPINSPARKALMEVATQIRSTGVGMVADVLAPTTNEETLDSMGNLETIPPYEHNGKKFPAGRIVMGANQTAGRVPRVLPLLEAQEMQNPILVDSTWLEVQHVDEFIQFLPAKSPRKWSIIVDNPLAAVKILEEAKAEGHGDKPYTSHPKTQRFRPSTVNRMLEIRVREVNEECARHITGTIKMLKRKTGISDDEIFQVPVLYSRKTSPSNPSNGDFQVSALYPNAVNGLVLTDSFYLTPKQWGLPNTAVTDTMQQAVEDAYRKAGFNVEFTDDWYYHLRKGDIHCLTNVLREIPGSQAAGA
ncbi:hypothetical protein ARSEF1564_003569 [Beauveria bassiana]